MDVQERGFLIYADSGILLVRNEVWWKWGLNSLIGLFEQVRIQINTTNTKVISGVP